MTMDRAIEICYFIMWLSVGGAAILAMLAIAVMRGSDDDTPAES